MLDLDQFVGSLIGVAIGVLLLTPLLIVLRVSGFWKRDRSVPSHARLIAQPGSTLELVDENGGAVVKVVLSEIQWDYNNGTTVVFEDYLTWCKRTRL